MGFTKTIIHEGTGASPKAGDTVTIEYTGWLKDISRPDNKGEELVAYLGRLERCTLRMHRVLHLPANIAIPLIQV